MQNNFFFQTKWHLVKTILFNTRLKDYKLFLSYAKEQRYEILPLGEFYRLGNRRGGGKNHLVLRHDVDWPGESTRRLFETEKSLGVRSTYYFRFSTIDKLLIDEMIEAGFEVGLHFETISDIIREQQLTDKNQLKMDYAFERFREDIRRFEEITGHKILTCCSHGAPENVKLGISNNSLTEGTNLSDYGIQFEAYDKDMYSKDVDCHIMDATLLFNYGFSYVDTPISAVNHQYQNIIFLSHPNHWWKPMGFNERIKPLIFMLMGKATYYTGRQFKRISQ